MPAATERATFRNCADVLVAEDGSELYLKYVRFYSQSRELPLATKGILRIEL